MWQWRKLEKEEEHVEEQQREGEDEFENRHKRQEGALTLKHRDSEQQSGGCCRDLQIFSFSRYFY
ncbi:MAG: hypothetical protein ACTSQE_01470 [Candidatus Heimdallarchaeaceae archaeon]